MPKVPDTVWIHAADNITTDGKLTRVYLTEAPVNFQKDQTKYYSEEQVQLLLKETINSTLDQAAEQANTELFWDFQQKTAVAIVCSRIKSLKVN